LSNKCITLSKNYRGKGSQGFLTNANGEINFFNLSQGGYDVILEDNLFNLEGNTISSPAELAELFMSPKEFRKVIVTYPSGKVYKGKLKVKAYDEENHNHSLHTLRPNLDGNYYLEIPKDGYSEVLFEVPGYAITQFGRYHSNNLPG
jgi:hypothetical protein